MTDAAPVSTPSKLQEQAQWLELVSAIAVGVLALNLARQALPIDVLLSFDDPGTVWRALSELGTRAIEVVPAALYLLGLWAAHGMFARFGRGELFTPAIVAGLSSIGSSLLWGGLWAVAITPTLLGWIEGPFRGLDLKLNGPELVILVLGGALVLLGKVMAKAAALQAEVDAFV